VARRGRRAGPSGSPSPPGRRGPYPESRSPPWCAPEPGGHATTARGSACAPTCTSAGLTSRIDRSHAFAGPLEALLGLPADCSPAGRMSPTPPLQGPARPEAVSGIGRLATNTTHRFQRWGRSCRGYRRPAHVARGSRCQGLGVRVSPARRGSAPVLGAWCRDVTTGTRGRSAWAIHQARATCAGAAPIRSATSRTAGGSSRCLAGLALERGLRRREVGIGQRARSSAPVRNPRRGE